MAYRLQRAPDPDATRPVVRQVSCAIALPRARTHAEPVKFNGRNRSSIVPWSHIPYYMWYRRSLVSPRPVYAEFRLSLTTVSAKPPGRDVQG